MDGLSVDKIFPCGLCNSKAKVAVILFVEHDALGLGCWFCCLRAKDIVVLFVKHCA